MSKRRRIACLLGLLCLAAIGTIWYALCRLRGAGELDALAQWESITLFDPTAYDLSVDSDFAVVPRAEISPEATNTILKQVTHHSGQRLWKGRLLGEVHLVNGRSERIAISYYGGFFKIVGRKGYYQTHGESRRQLENLVRRVLSEEFIPKRMAQKPSGNQ